mgnify:CR=1 FL=1
MSTYYTYHITFVDSVSKRTHVLLEDPRVFPNDSRLNKAVRERWYDVVIRDDVTTVVHGVHNGSADYGWIWSKHHDELVRVF